MSKYPTFADVVRRLVPIVGVLTPRKGGWSGDNQLGHVEPFRQSSNDRQTVLKLDEWGPPEIWTVSLAIDTRPDDNTLAYDVVAEINFGAGGSTQVVKIDWNQGAQISLPMNAVNVIAFYRGISVGVTNTNDLRLSAQISRGSRSEGGAPVFTIAKRQILANGAADVFELPAFATGVKLVPSFSGSPGTIATGDIAEVYHADVIVMTLDNIVAGGVNAAMRGSDFLTIPTLPVAGGARFVRVNNGSGGSITYDLIAEIAG